MRRGAACLMLALTLSDLGYSRASDGTQGVVFLMIGFGKDVKTVLAFAEEVAERGHPRIAKDLKALMARRGVPYSSEGIGINQRRWLNETFLEGVSLAVHWRRYVDRLRQAERRQRRKTRSARIEIESELKQELEALKRPGETWSDLLRRLAKPLRSKISRRRLAR